MSKKITFRQEAVLVLSVVLVLAVVFETLQQQYYLERFDLAPEVAFLDLLASQAYRWILWIIIGGLLYVFVSRQVKRDEPVLVNYARVGMAIALLVIVNLVVISVIGMYTNAAIFSWDTFFNEYFPFYIFQKAPIYTLGYLAAAIIFNLYFQKEQLEIKVVALQGVSVHEPASQANKASVEGKLNVLSIRLGNKVKLIAIDQIRWVASDDYCVRIHCMDGAAHSMRISMKAMMPLLNENFLRVHRTAIVNMKEASLIHIKDTPYLTLSNQQQIPIAKSRLKSVLSFYNRQ